MSQLHNLPRAQGTTASPDSFFAGLWPPSLMPARPGRWLMLVDVFWVCHRHCHCVIVIVMSFPATLQCSTHLNKHPWTRWWTAWQQGFSFNSRSWCRGFLPCTYKRVNLETAPDWQRWWSSAPNRQFVRSISLLVKDNLESLPLALPQPRSSQRAKEK